MTDDHARRIRIEVLFDQCADLPTGQRARFLEVAAAGDLGLKREVEALLASADRADSTGRLERIVAAAFDLPRSPAPGVGDRYGQMQKMGGGGMSVVFRAVERETGRLVALKFLSESLASDAVLKRRFYREAQAAAGLDHPNIGTIHRIEEADDGRLVIVMPFYEGGTLKAAIARGPLPVSQAVACAAQVADGLAHAHAAGIIHRDIKPANLIFDSEGGLRILDFGIAKVAGEKLTRHRTGARHACLHEPGAGGRGAPGSPNRPLGAGRGAARDAHRPTAVLLDVHRDALPGGAIRGSALDPRRPAGDARVARSGGAPAAPEGAGPALPDATSVSAALRP